MRACALLSVAAIQNGQIRDMHQYLGKYHTLNIMEGLYDEKSWPKDLSAVEVEVRRRLVCHCACAITATGGVELMPLVVLVDVYTRCVFGDRVGRHGPFQRNPVQCTLPQRGE